MEKINHSIVLQHSDEELLAMFHARGTDALAALKGEPIWPQDYFDRTRFTLNELANGSIRWHNRPANQRCKL